MDYKYCKHCGAKINMNAKYCRNCGARQDIFNNRLVNNYGHQNNYQDYQQRPVQYQVSHGNQYTESNPQVDVWHIYWKNWSNYNGCTNKYLYNKIMIPCIVGIVLLAICSGGFGWFLYYAFLSCLTIRRAHDVGMPTGWAVTLVIFFGGIFAIILMFIDSRNISNGRYKQRAINKGYPPIV